MTRLRIARWLAGGFGVGVLLQTGACGLSAETQQALVDQLFLPQVANVIADTVFFLLDNALVRISV